MTQQNNDFEKWFESKYVDASESTRIVSLKAWQAATTESDKRIAELKDEINDLNKEQVKLNKWLDSNRVWFENSNKELTELQSHINVLREALETISGFQVDEVVDDICDKALASTPAQSLQTHDDEVIERCAEICISIQPDYVDNSVYHECAKAIQALKGK